jgi:hypothetical protein
MQRGHLAVLEGLCMSELVSDFNEELVGFGLSVCLSVSVCFLVCLCVFVCVLLVLSLSVCLFVIVTE